MASSTILSSVLMERLERSVPKSKRKLQKHLRSSGQAYISRTGKLIPAKEVADELCQCPHKCDASVPREARQRLFDHFYGLSDADMQNRFLRQHMDLRARLNGPDQIAAAHPTMMGSRPPRRITCKYLVPLLPSSDTVEVCQKAFVSAFVITTKRVRLQREKLISSLGLNSYSSHNRGKNNINNNNNNVTIKDNNKPLISDEINDLVNNRKQISLLKQTLQTPVHPQPMDVDTTKKIKAEHDEVTEVPYCDGPIINKAALLSNNPLIPYGLLLPEGVTIIPVTATPDHARDMAIVNNFFSNQLWKPEYIGAYS